MENLTSWGQIAFYGAGALAAVLIGVSQLMKQAFSITGGLITNLKAQNDDQQKQLDNQNKKIIGLGKALGEADKKCDERIAELERGRVKAEKDIEETKGTVSAIAAKING